jgi:hypothetical protein
VNKAITVILTGLVFGFGAFATTVSAPAPVSVSLATYYNYGSGFTSAWQPGGAVGSSPSSGSIIRISAFYRNANGTVYDLGNGAPATTFTVGISSNTYSLSALSRAVVFSPGYSATSAITYSGLTLGTTSAWTLVITVAATPDANTPITGAFQMAEGDQLVFATAQTINWVEVRLVSYVPQCYQGNNLCATGGFVPYTYGSSVNDSTTRIVGILINGLPFVASLSSSNTNYIFQLPTTYSPAAGAVAIAWSQNTLGDQYTYVSFYVNSSQIT